MSRNPSVTGRSKRAKEQRERRRQQLLDAAKHVFAAQGYHATSVGDIISHASVARGTFYLYFPSKYAIFSELLDDILQRLQVGIQRVDVSPGAPAPRTQLHQNLSWLLSLLHSQPELLRLLLWEAVGLDDDLNKKLASFHRNMFTLTQRSLQTGLALGIVRPCDTAVVSRCIVGTLKEVLLSLLIRQDLQLDDMDRLADELLDFCLGGLMQN